MVLLEAVECKYFTVVDWLLFTVNYPFDSIYVHPHTCIYLYIHVHVHVVTPDVYMYMGVLCCFALFVCLTLLASFFHPSHLSLKTCVCIGIQYNNYVGIFR